MRSTSQPPAHFLLATALAALLLATPLQAKKNDPNVQLVFVPQQTVAGASADLTSDMLSGSIRLVVLDGRQIQDPAKIGTRTDDDDRQHVLRAVDSVEGWVERVLRQLAADWGLGVDETASRTFEVALLRFKIEETNRAVGATFVADVALEGRLSRGATRLWTGTASGDATRYGKKFSNANVNEVLSDAVLEAWAELLSDTRLHRAWSGQTTATASPGGAAPGAAVEPVTPADLLASLRNLMAEGFDDSTLVAFVRQRQLSRPLSTEDLVAWKQAGVPEPVVQAALDLPVR